MVPPLVYCWCSCHSCHRRRLRYVSSNSKSSSLRNNFRRASFYLASTSLQDLNVTELMWYLTASHRYSSQMIGPSTTTNAATLHPSYHTTSTTQPTTISTTFTTTLPPGTFHLPPPQRPPPPPPTYPLPPTPLLLKRKGREHHSQDYCDPNQRSHVTADTNTTYTTTTNNNKKCSPGHKGDSQFCQVVNWVYNEGRPSKVTSKKKTHRVTSNSHKKKSHNRHNNNQEKYQQPQDNHHHYELDPLRPHYRSCGDKAKVSSREDTRGRKLQKDKGSSSCRASPSGGQNPRPCLSSPRPGHQTTTHMFPPIPLPEPPAQPPHVVATFLSHSRYIP